MTGEPWGRSEKKWGVDDRGDWFGMEPDQGTNVQPGKTGKGKPTMEHGSKLRRWHLLAAAATAVAVFATASPASAEEQRGPLGYIPGVEDIPGNPGAFGNILGIPDADGSALVSGSYPLTAGVYVVGKPPVDEDTWTGMVLVEPQLRTDQPWTADEPVHAEFAACLSQRGRAAAYKAEARGQAFAQLPTRTVQRCAKTTNVGSIATSEVIVGLREGMFPSWREVPMDVLEAITRLEWHGYFPTMEQDPDIAWVRESHRVETTALKNQPHILAAMQAARDAKLAEWARRGVEWRSQCYPHTPGEPLDQDRYTACIDAWDEQFRGQATGESTAAAMDAAEALGAFDKLGWPSIPEQDAEKALNAL